MTKERRTRVLLVVDDDDMMEQATHALREFSCATTSDAGEALGLVTNGTFDVVVADVHLPANSGIDLMSAARAVSPWTEFVLLSGGRDDDAAARALASGASSYLTVPLSGPDMFFAVRKAGLHAASAERAFRSEGCAGSWRGPVQGAVTDNERDFILYMARAVEIGGDETVEHAARVGACARALAGVSGHARAWSEMVGLAAMAHDIGKIGVPDTILLKRAGLTENELRITRQHATNGARILGDASSPVMRLARNVTLMHHERWDGKGYPMGVSGGDIPEAARIVALVDSYDSLQSDRVYRVHHTEGQALALIREGRGSQFDPRLLDCMMANISAIRRARATATSGPRPFLDVRRQALAAAMTG